MAAAAVVVAADRVVACDYRCDDSLDGLVGNDVGIDPESLRKNPRVRSSLLGRKITRSLFFDVISFGENSNFLALISIKRGSRAELASCTSVAADYRLCDRNRTNREAQSTD